MKAPIVRLTPFAILAAALTLANCASQPGSHTLRVPVSSVAPLPLPAPSISPPARSASGQETEVEPESDTLLGPPLLVIAPRDSGDDLDGWPSCKAEAELNVERVLAVTPPLPIQSIPHGVSIRALLTWFRSLH